MVAAPLLQSPSELPTVLTTAELCERWRCTPRTLERMARDGRIRRVKLRGGVRYPTDEVLRIEQGEDRPAVQRVAEAQAVYAVLDVPRENPLLHRARETGSQQAASDAMNRAPAVAEPVGARFIAPPTSTAEPRPTLPPALERTWYTV